MITEATTRPPSEVDADTIALGVLAGEDVDPDLMGAEDASAELGKVAVAHGSGRRFVLVGMGRRDELDPEVARVAAATAMARASELPTRTLCWQLPRGGDAALAAGVVQGTLLRAYSFERYKRAARAGLTRLVISARRDMSDAVADAGAIVQAQNRARDLINTPANDLTPAALADYAVQRASQLEGLTARILDGEEIAAEGMGAFAAVAQGSAQSARLIRLEYEGAAAVGPKLGLIGKAVTFDSGGLSLKPAAKMHEMKFDMAGGAAVIEATSLLAQLRAPVRALALVGATENLPGGTALKPGDIVTALDGTTIEVNNTDAEGRLVLADCIALARREDAERLIDVATLTGGVLTALGSFYAGLMSNDDALAQQLLESGRRTGEVLWRLPLDPLYARMMQGRYAELTNHSERREASPITGAEFLHHFAGDVPWAHLDIAGTAYDVPREYYAGKGATGFGVRLLVDLARSIARS